MSSNMINEYHFYGIRRSGNHALINWIINHYDGVFIHLDDVDFEIDKDPFESAQRINVKGVKYFKIKRKIIQNIKKMISNPEMLIFVRGDKSVNRSYLKSICGKNILISFENKFPDVIDCEDYIGKNKARKNILILRYYKNMFASLIKSGMVGKSNIEKYEELYCHYCYFWKKVEKNKDWICINYDKWVVNREYRINIGTDLGFHTEGEILRDIPYQGGGSSFSKQKSFNSDVAQVLNRWKIMKDNPLLNEILKNKKLNDCYGMLNFDNFSIVNG